MLLVFLLTAFLGSAALAAPVRRVAAPSAGVVRIQADSVHRWQDDGASRMDLKGKVRIFQGETRLTGERLLVRLTEGPRNGALRGVLEVYGDSGALLEAGATETLNAPFLLQYEIADGLTIDGALLTAGDAPAPDAFLVRAGKYSEEGLADGVPERAAGILSILRPSAEEMSITDLTETGAVVTLRGNASLGTGDIAVSADLVRVRLLFREPGYRAPRVHSIYAEGAVALTRGLERVTSESLYFDMLADTGLALDARVRAHDPERGISVQFHADAVRELSQHRFAAEGLGWFSTSRMADPHWRVQGKNLEMVRGRVTRPRRGRAAAEAPESLVVSSRQNIVYIGPVPVFYWPYLAKDVRTGAFLLQGASLGSSSTLGQFLRLSWDLYDLGFYASETSELALLTDYYSERGIGFGLNFNYESDARFGFARAYYIRDHASEDDEDLPVLRKDRGELTLRHREIFSDAWHADAEIGYLSDRRFLRTYDRLAFDEDKDRETQIFLVRRAANSLFTVHLRERINDFQTQVSRETVAYHIVAERLANSPLLWTSHSEAGRLRLQYDEVLDLDDPDGIGRFHTEHELSAPFQAGPVRLDPYVWGALTGYTERADDKSGLLRAAGGFGVRAATNLYRTYDVRSELFDIDRLRHIITPTIGYKNIAYVSHGPSDLIPHDEIDALDELQMLELGLRSRLQTYRLIRGERTRVEVLLADVKYILMLSGHAPNLPRDDFILANVRWLLSEDITLASEDNIINVDRGRVEAANGELVLDYWQPVQVVWLQKYYLDLQTAGEPSHNVSILSFSWQPVFSRWRVDFATSYDFDADKEPDDTKSNNLGTGLFFTRELEDWAITLGAEMNFGRSNDTVFRFSLSPPGSPRGHPYTITGRSFATGVSPL